MNILKGNIANVTSKDIISLVEIDTQCGIFTSLIFETPETASYLKKGKEVMLLFKEAEVGLAKNTNGDSTSYLNSIRGVVRNITKGSILAEVAVSTGNAIIKSIVPIKSIDKMHLKDGDDVHVVITPNEISLEIP